MIPTNERERDLLARINRAGGVLEVDVRSIDASLSRRLSMVGLVELARGFGVFSANVGLTEAGREFVRDMMRDARKLAPMMIGALRLLRDRGPQYTTRRAVVGESISGPTAKALRRKGLARVIPATFDAKGRIDYAAKPGALELTDEGRAILEELEAEDRS